MIYFKKIRYKNLLSTGNIFTEIDLNSHRTTLIVGENGAGKSTILDALSFVLFGKAFRKINKPQLLNSITQKNLVVEVEFSINSIDYKIIRGIKPTIFEVYQSGKLLNQSAESRDYQEILEKQILKVSHKSFCQVVVLGSATFQPFMQLSSGQRREIIEDLLDLQIFTTMNALLKNKISDNNDKIITANNERKIIDEKVKLIKQHLIEMQNNNDQLIEDKKQRLRDTDVMLEKLNNEYEALKEVVAESEKQLVDDKALSKKIDKLSQLKHQIEAKRALLNKDINFFTKHENCPTCTQTISNDFREATLQSKTSEIKQIDDALEKLVRQYNETSNQLNQIIQIQSEINDKKMELHKKKVKISSLVDYLTQLQEEIDSIKNNNKKIDKNKIDELNSEKEKIEKTLEELTEERNVLNSAGILLKDGGIKARIVKQYVPIINKLINKYLSSMEFMCQFELNEQFDETIKSRYRDEFSYASFSEGEKQKIDLSVLFTWRAIAKMRNSINTNLLIFDEVLDSSLDSNAIDYFMEIIKSVADQSNVFIISHREQMSDKFEKVIRFEKHKNFSKVV